MKKFVVLSVNENQHYLYYVPLTIWCWKKFGWNIILFTAAGDRPQNKVEKFVFDYTLDAISDEQFVHLNSSQYKSETIAQMSRLYAACIIDDNSYLMTSDVDMLPLSDYWKFNPEKITIWGHDLTAYQHMPICYQGMRKERWVEVMHLISNNCNALIKRDLDSMPDAISEDKSKVWTCDQTLITNRINEVQSEKDFIDRGTYLNGYPIGRVDRSAWHLEHETFIDCHMMRGIYRDKDAYDKTMELLHKIWPQEDFTWFEEYTKKFAQLIND